MMIHVWSWLLIGWCFVAGSVGEGAGEGGCSEPGEGGAAGADRTPAGGEGGSGGPEGEDQRSGEGEQRCTPLFQSFHTKTSTFLQMKWFLIVSLFV